VEIHIGDVRLLYKAFRMMTWCLVSIVGSIKSIPICRLLVLIRVSMKPRVKGGDMNDSRIVTPLQSQTHKDSESFSRLDIATLISPEINTLTIKFTR